MLRADPVFSSDDLKKVWKDFQAAIVERGMRLYPETPILENGDRLAVANWPDEDWGAFLDIAEAVGARLIYAESVDADEETLDEFIANIEMYDEDSKHANVAKHLRDHINHPYRIEAGFMNQGLYHQWALEADWWIAIERLLRELRPNQHETEDDDFDDQGEDRHALYERVESEGWIRQIARDRRFLLAEQWSSEEEQLVAEMLGAFLHQQIDAKGEHRSLIRRVSSHARRLFASEIRDELQDEIIEQIPRLAAELENLHDDWRSTTMPIREGYARRYIKDRFGYPFSLAVKKVARQKEPAKDQSLFPQ